MRPFSARPLAAAAFALAAACAPESPTSPPPPSSPPNVAGAAFRFTIDGSTGRVAVTPPGVASASGGPSFSLIGSEGVRFSGTGPDGAIVCTWSSVPNNSKRRRCTFDFTLTNRLKLTDLVTPTSFPKPPSGTTGLLVFPFTAAALGVPGSAAVPSPAWDNPPANFFNDFGSCTTGKTSDCYPWKRIAAPLYAGTTSAVYQAGFDVDKNAQSATAYVVVAADLRENPRVTHTIVGDPVRCGFVSTTASASGEMKVADGDNGVSVGLCSFDLPAIPAGAEILSATLRAYQESAPSNFDDNGTIVADHLVYGFLDEDDDDSPALSSAFGTLSTNPTVEYKTLEVAAQVRADIEASRFRSQFRLRFTHFAELGGTVTFSGPAGPNPPQLVIVYHNP